jgi:hypothetical protein
MDLGQVMDEVGNALGSIAGLRVFPYSVARVSPPAAVVLWPERIDFDAAMGRGGDRITLPVIVLIGKVDERSARDRLAPLLSSSGPGSVKQVVEDYEAVSWDSVRVVSAVPDSFTSGENTYIGATFTLDIIGKGSS